MRKSKFKALVIELRDGEVARLRQIASELEKLPKSRITTDGLALILEDIATAKGNIAGLHMLH